MLENIIIAHRGYHNNEIPENSLEAFKICLENKIPIEFDIHILTDSNIVVFHDDNLYRMTGIDKNIEDLTYEELKKYKLKNTKERIPLLIDVLKLIDGQVLLDIELKTNSNKHLLEDELLKILKKYNGDILLKSFNYKTVLYLKKKCDYKVGLLYSNIKNKKNRFLRLKNIIKKNINFNIFIKPDFIGCNKNCVLDKSISSFKGPILVWTIKTKEDFNKFKNKNFGLISEYNLKKHI